MNERMYRFGLIATIVFSSLFWGAVFALMGVSAGDL